MEGLNAYPEELLKSLLITLSHYKNYNIDFFDTKSSFWAKYWRFLYILPFCIVYNISLWMYVVKMFVDGIDPFKEADIIAIWLVANQVFNKSAYILACQYVLLPLAETLIRIFFLEQEGEFRLIFPWAPFAVDNWPTYLAVYAFQGYTHFFLLYLYLGSYLLLIDLSTFISIQFTLLQEDVMSLRPTNDRKTARLGFDDEITGYGERRACNIKEFIKRHQDTILLTQELNTIFNKITFINLLVSTVVICFFAIAAKVSGTAYSVTYYLAIVHVMVTMYIISYCSEMLSASSMGIAESAVKNLWYKGDLRYQRTISFIIMRSQKPCTLRSLYSSISISMTFNRVLKTTYSYFSVANHMYERRD